MMMVKLSQLHLVSLVLCILVVIPLVNCSLLQQVKNTKKMEINKKWLTNNTRIKMAAKQNFTTETIMENIKLASLKNLFDELILLVTNFATKHLSTSIKNDKQQQQQPKKEKRLQEMTSRSYSQYGGSGTVAGGGGGGGGFQSNSGNMMYYSNFDTALTTLAFLSFGVFLLNMIFSFLDFGTPLGPITREDGKDGGGGGGKSKRSTSPTMSPEALLALNAIQESLMENERLTEPECAFKLFCDATHQPHLRQKVDDMFSILTSFILTGKLRTNRKLWATSKLRQTMAMLENGGCADLFRMCPNKT